jgi:hypothetical protein
MKVIMPDKYNWKQLLPSFRPFEYHSDSEKEPMCSIRMVEQPITIEPDSAQLLSEVSDVLGHWFCLMETDQNYIFDIQFLEHGNCYRMVSDKLFSTATAYVDGSDRVAGLVLSSFLMIAFAQSAVLHQTILIHSSVIEKDRQGYAFLGKSGTGKSTHSALWLKYIEGTELLNDDNPAIRIEENGEVYIYGTPWSGKTPCYKNRSALLKAFVRLEQAPENHFQWKDGVSALITILPSCSSMRWNSLLYTGMCNILEKVIGKVKIGYLKCLPDKEAAYLCYKETEKE